MLRARYRCTMCYKHCLIPCSLTAAEFRMMQQGAFEEEFLDEASEAE